MIRFALWALTQIHLTLNGSGAVRSVAQQLRSAQNEHQAANRIPVYAIIPRRDMTTALPAQDDWSQGEQYTTILRQINGEPRVESGYIPGADDLASLTDPLAPHEVSGALRMFQTGTTGPEIARKLGKSGRQVQYEMNLGLEDQEDAGLRGQAMYNDRIQVCSCGDAMHKASGSSFRCPSDTRITWNGTTDASGRVSD